MHCCEGCLTNLYVLIDARTITGSCAGGKKEQKVERIE